jgi:methylmalonyl-CoA/ethylmalonyl-CoA epimerase
MDDVTELRIAMTVTDFEAAVTFYRDALGLPQLADWSSDDGRVVLFEAGRATLEILDERQAEFIDRVEAGRRVAGKVRLAIEVADVDTVSARLIAAGAEQVAPATVTPWGDRNARVQSPDGMQLTLFESDH